LFSQAWDLSSCSLDALKVLQDVGAVEVRSTEFGDVEVAARISSFYWMPLMCCQQPSLESTIVPDASQVAQLAKLDLLCILHRQGFEATSRKLDHWHPDGESVYRQQSVLNGSKYYFGVLVCRAAVIAKGLTSIWHDGSAAYYRSLLLLPDLRAVRVLMDDKERGVEVYERLLKARGLGESGRIANLQAIENPVGDEPDGGDEPPEVQVEAHALLQASLRPFPLPPIGLGFDMASVVVNFDNCSHSSGIMRGYVKCPWGHRDCFKYQQVNVAGSRERLIAFLCAWVIMGEGLDREDHCGQNPSPANVDLQTTMLFPPGAD
jgi:hypothetical protein